MNNLTMMNPTEKKESFTSLELVELINQFREQEGNRKELLHKTFLEVIRDEFQEEINEQKILPVEYKDKKGEKRPMFELTLKQSRQVLVRESRFVRRAVIEYIDQLESRLIPKDYSSALRALADEWDKNQRLMIENQSQKQIIMEYEPKVTYYNKVLQSVNAVPITHIAKDYGESAKAFNKLLHNYGIQYKLGDTWFLYQQYADKGYTKSETISYVGKDGATYSRLNTKWTQEGRLFLYDVLKQKGILPLMER